MNKNIYRYVNWRMGLFGNFLNFTYSFLQNVLARILSINNIYRSLIIAYARGDEVVKYFDYGRLTRIMLIFDPIEIEDADDDWYYNADILYY